MESRAEKHDAPCSRSSNKEFSHEKYNESQTYRHDCPVWRSAGHPVLAQPGPGMGGMGGGMGGSPVAQKTGSGMGPGAGQRGAYGMRFSQRNTAGWTLMSAEERTAHREKMLAAKTFAECKTLQTEHHTQMEARAKEKGLTLPTPRQNVCDRMQARGLLK